MAAERKRAIDGEEVADREEALDIAGWEDSARLSSRVDTLYLATFPLSLSASRRPYAHLLSVFARRKKHDTTAVLITCQHVSSVTSDTASFKGSSAKLQSHQIRKLSLPDASITGPRRWLAACAACEGHAIPQSFRPFVRQCALACR